MCASDKVKLNSPSGGLTDGSTPLKYMTFLAQASKNHQVAFQNAIEAIYGPTGPTTKY
jgi:hypothetical protein